MQRIVNEKIATPFAQRNLPNTLRAMFKRIDAGARPLGEAVAQRFCARVVSRRSSCFGSGAS
jgi:hypothetical protein